MLGLKKEVQMNKFLFSLFCIFMLSSCSDSGLFGYDNYDDCFLGKMKGQSSSMTASAKRACKINFPNRVPQSFDECVIDKMYGQPIGVILNAKKACRGHKK